MRIGSEKGSRLKDSYINTHITWHELILTKSEVEQSMKGAVKLNQVSELQRARLNRQIEQFEELQRILIQH